MKNLITLIVLTMFIGIPCLAGDPIFYDPVEYSLYDDAWQPVFVDYNNDGYWDMAVACGSELRFFPNNGDGTFGSPNLYYDGFVDARAAIAHDFDQNGHEDIAVADYGDNKVHIFWSDENGDFSTYPVQVVTVGNNPSSLCAGGFGGQNQFDIAVVCEGDLKVYVLKYRSDCYCFDSPSVVASGNGNWAVAPTLCMVDIDLDNDPDLAVAAFSQYPITLLENDGSGDFTEVDHLGSSEIVRAICAGDLDNSYGSDLVSMNYSGSFNTYIKTSSSSFNSQPNTYYFSGTDGGTALANDFDHDGYTDIAISYKSATGWRMGIYLNDNTGDFDFNNSYGVASEPLSMGTIDLDDNNSNDVAIASNTSHKVSVLLNKLSFDYVCGDANGDGTVNIGDPVFLINYLFREGDAPDPYYSGDANGDCFVDLGDAVYIIAYIFRGGPESKCIYCGGAKLAGAIDDNQDYNCLSPVIIGAEKIDEKTVYSISSDIDLYGLQLELSGRVESEATLNHNIPMYVSKVNSHSALVGFVDLSSQSYIAAGQPMTLEVGSDASIIGGRAWDEQGNQVRVMIEPARKDNVLPDEFELCQNHPNPFNPITDISFNLPAAAQVKLEVFNVNGQKVVTLADDYFEAGSHSVTWDANGVASGIYYYRIKAGDFVETKSMTLLK